MNGPRPAIEPQNRRLYLPLTPRPCGEITNGSAGWRAGPYHDGSTRYAVAGAPTDERYVNVSVRTPACAADAATAVAAAKTAIAKRIVCSYPRTPAADLNPQGESASRSTPRSSPGSGRGPSRRTRPRSEEHTSEL